jgi:hypothetical protein
MLSRSSANGPIRAIFRPGRQRQQAAVVAQQHDRRPPASRDSARMAGVAVLAAWALGSIERNGRSNRPSVSFRLSTRRTALSTTAIGTAPLGDQFGQVAAVEAALHADVDPGQDRQPRGVLVVGA